MDEAESWYPLWLFPASKSNLEPLNAKVHNKQAHVTLKNSNIKSSAVTHIYRGSAARMADLRVAGEADIRKAGRWDMSAMTRHYLTTLPRETMRVLAGFPKEMGSFFVFRDVDPPKCLEEMIFPQAGVWSVLLLLVGGQA